VQALAQALIAFGLGLGIAAAAAALYGRYRTLPALLTGPAVCKLDAANGCQVLFRTRFAALLGVPNAALGLACYAAILCGLTQGWPLRLLFAAAIAALAMSLYLAYILLRDKLQCRICWAGHLANLTLCLGLALRMGTVMKP